MFCATQAKVAICSTEGDSFATCHNRFPITTIQRILKSVNLVSSFGCHLESLFSFSRKGDVWGRAFFCITTSNCSTSPICHVDTGNGNLVLTNFELIGIAIAGCESRDAGERFCCRFVFSFCYIKRDEGCGVLGSAWLDKGIELVIAVLIRFYTTDAEAVDIINLGSSILVVEAINLYYHSRHFALHGERKLIAFGIALLTVIRHEVVGNKRSLIIFRRQGDFVEVAIERSRVVGGESHLVAFPFQELAALRLPFFAVKLIGYGILAISLDANHITIIKTLLVSFSSTQRIAAGEAIGRCFTYLRSDAHSVRVAMECREEVF